jgi:hypothetical protein
MPDETTLPAYAATDCADLVSLEPAHGVTGE